MIPWVLIVAGLLSAGSADYLVVSPDELVTGLVPLVGWREEKGLSVRIISMNELDDAEAVRKEVLKEYFRGEKRLKYLLLVGDVGEGSVPTFVREHYRWVKTDEKEMATDVPYGDMEGDFLPEIAVGRLPVRTPEELNRVVRKIIGFEAVPRDGARRLKLVLFAGASGFPAMAENFLESISRNMLDSILPLRYDLKVMYANLASPYCPPPDELGKRFMELINGGPALSVFAGHGSKDSCFGMKWNRGRITYHCGFAADQLALLDEHSVSGPLFYIACDNGFFDGEEDCLAEATLLSPGGPVAAVASSRYSHPLTNLYFSQALLESLDHSETVGGLLLDAIKRSYEKSNPLANTFLRNIEGTMDGDVDVARLKKDQALIYNLMGDPATEIRPPKPLMVEAVVGDGGAGIDFKFASPFEKAKGYAALYLARSWEPPRKRLPDPEKDEETWRKAKGETFKQINDKEVLRIPLEVEGGDVKARFAFEDPPRPGRYRLVVYLKTKRKDAAGAVPLVLPAD